MSRCDVESRKEGGGRGQGGRGQGGRGQGGEGEGGVIANLVLPLDKESGISKWRKPVSSYKSIDDLEKVLHHMCYNELRVAPEEHSMLITEPLFTDLLAREKITQLLFETFTVEGVMFAPQEFLAAVGYGKTTCLVVNCGNTYTSIVPIWKSNILRHNAVVLPVGGQDVTRALKLMIDADKSVQTYNKAFDIKEDIVDDMKIKLSYVALDFHQELQKTAKKKAYELPDGQTIEVGKPLFKCTECLFNPELFGMDSPGCVEGIGLVIDNLESRYKGDIITGPNANVIITGSSTMFVGFVERIQSELRTRYPQYKMIVTAAPERKQVSWIGGSIWASLAKQNKGCWVSKEDYDEYGPSVVHTRCI